MKHSLTVERIRWKWPKRGISILPSYVFDDFDGEREIQNYWCGFNTISGSPRAFLNPPQADGVGGAGATPFPILLIFPRLRGCLHLNPATDF